MQPAVAEAQPLQAPPPLLIDMKTTGSDHHKFIKHFYQFEDFARGRFCWSAGRRTLRPLPTPAGPVRAQTQTVHLIALSLSDLGSQSVCEVFQSWNLNLGGEVIFKPREEKEDGGARTGLGKTRGAGDERAGTEG